MSEPRCKHNWITPPECPQCVSDERDELKDKHLAWALDEISGGDYSKTPKHECEFSTNPEKGHCDFCCGFWAAVGAAFPDKLASATSPSYDAAELEATIEKGTIAWANVTVESDATPAPVTEVKP